MQFRLSLASNCLQDFRNILVEVKRVRLILEIGKKLVWCFLRSSIYAPAASKSSRTLAYQPVKEFCGFYTFLLNDEMVH